MPLDSAAPLAAGELIAGRFRVIGPLGSGGMGDVYEVEHELTKHHRALKLLHRSYLELPEAVSRFLREASAAGRIGSRHIVETFDAGQLPTGEPYLVMELLRGQTLAERLEHAGALPVDVALEIVRQASIGIQAAHEAGIVHRDLKPENLFLVEGPEPLVKILDFGISKFDPELTGTPSLTTDGTTLGTPYYMAPEQVRGGQDVDAQSDVYALGVVLYECLIGKPPFEAESLPALCVLIHEGEYVPPRKLRPDLTRALEDAVMTAMARDRSRRYKTARELAETLEKLLSGEVLSLEDTLAVASSALTVKRPGTAQARSIAPPPASATDPNAHTQRSMDALPPAPRTPARRGLLLLAGLAVAAAAALVVWKAGVDRPGPAPTLEPARAPNTSPPPTAIEPLAPPTSERSSSPEADGDAGTRATSKPSHAAPRSSKPGVQNPRAKEHGLGTEDPFGP